MASLLKRLFKLPDTPKQSRRTAQQRIRRTNRGNGRTINSRPNIEPLESRQLLSVDLSGTFAPVGPLLYNDTRAAISLALTNSGDTKTTRPFIVKFFAAAQDAEFSPATATLLTTVKRTTAIPAGATVSLATTAPMGRLTEGDYRIYAVLDWANTIAETDETNNVVSSGAVTVRPRQLDLTGGITLQGQPTMVADSITAAVADVTIANSAESLDPVAPAKSVKVSVVARLVGATTKSRDISLNVLPVAINVSQLAPGASVTQAVALRFPPLMPIGTYNIIVKIDTGKSVAETDETNNEAVLSQTITVTPRIVTAPSAGTSGIGSLIPTSASLILSNTGTLIRLTSPPATVPVPVPGGSGSTLPLPTGGTLPTI